LGATIRRGPRPVDNFTLISNALLRDASLSLKARGLAAWLWSHAETYSLSVERIADQTGGGLAAVRTGIQELEARGYLVRERERDASNRTTGMVYILCEAPENPSSEPPSENPPVENPPVEDRRDYKKTNSKKTNEKKTNNKSAPYGDAPAEPEGLFPSEDALRGSLGMDTTARDVVAAYVDSYKAGHQDHAPLQADIKKIAGQAARLIKDPAVKADTLLQAATALGRTQFTDLGGQYRRQLQAPGNQDPTRGYFRAEQKNVFVPPVGETTAEANARVAADREWLKAYNAGTATLADRPE
jgi:hypothetical protein